MRAHIVVEGVVVNTIIVQSISNGLLDADVLGGGIGWTWDGETLTPPAVQPLTLADYDAALTAHLDAEARTHHYADRISCSVRAGYSGPFQAEGIAFAQWMDAQNATGYAILADFQAGNIPQPTIAEFIGQLAPMVWP